MDKRKLEDIFPTLEVKSRLTDLYPPEQQQWTLTSRFPYKKEKGGFGGGYLNPSTIPIATPVWVPPVPSFSVTFNDNTINGVVGSLTRSSGPTDVISFGNQKLGFTFTNTTDDTTYTSLLWTINDVTFRSAALPSSPNQTYVIPPDPDPFPSRDFTVWDITLTAFWHGTQGVAYMRLVDYNVNYYDLINGTTHFHWLTQDPANEIFPITTLLKQYVTDNDTWEFQVQHDADSDPDFISITELHNSTDVCGCDSDFTLIATSPNSWLFSFNFVQGNFRASTDFWLKTTAAYSAGPSPVYRYLHYRFDIPEPPDAVAAIRFSGIGQTKTGLNGVNAATRPAGSLASVNATNVSTGSYDHYTFYLYDNNNVVVPGFTGLSVVGSFRLRYTVGVIPYKYVLILFNVNGRELSRAEVLFNITVTAIVPSVTHNGVVTTYTTEALSAASPTSYSSTTNTTTLTFTNSTAATDSNWDNSVMAVTVYNSFLIGDFERPDVLGQPDGAAYSYFDRSKGGFNGVADGANDWKFSGGGIFNGISPWTRQRPTVFPNGKQACFIQLGSFITQAVYLPSGTYTLTLFIATRDLAFINPVAFTVDGVQVGALISPPSVTFTSYTTTAFAVTAPGCVFKFQGTELLQDATTLVDKITIQKIS